MNVSDLLARPWSDMHCGEAVVEGLQRLGMAEAALYVPADQSAAARVVEALEGGAPEGRWGFVSYEAHRAQVGNLIVADGPEGAEDVYHVSLVIAPGMTLTSSRRHGVHCVPLAKTRNVRGVYRWEPAA